MLSLPRNGFTLMEILVVLAIGIVLAAVTVPSLIGRAEQAGVDGSAESLEGIASAITSMYQDVAQYPGQLRHLSAPIDGETSLCGTAYSMPANWNGPYLNRAVPATGLPLPIGIVSNTLAYTAGPPLLWISVPGVSHGDARALNGTVDADADSASGAVRWGPVSGAGLVDLSYVRPVKACP